ncbi:MAG: hypothetical protein JWN43_4389 [Gammaproteobacteria bacterium]|nr:hypothetical protein [Gammaproteobacteria bacterium]
MRNANKITLFGLSLMLLLGDSALGDDMVTIRIYNDGSDSIVVTVFDLNASPPGTALASQRINGFAWVPLSVEAGADGNGHVKWMARSGDEDFQRCGRGNVRALGDDASVRVSANSGCASTARDF